MNIFAVSENPAECAKVLDDRRMVKMVLETTQILCTVAHLHGQPAPYKPTHQHHPCVKWATYHEDNEIWLLFLLSNLLQEYTRRFKRVHKCASVFQQLLFLKPHGVSTLWHNGVFHSPPPNCTTRKDQPLYEAYRDYLNDKWKYDRSQNRPPKWTNRKEPDFLV